MYLNKLNDDSLSWKKKKRKKAKKTEKEKRIKAWKPCGICLMLKENVVCRRQIKPVSTFKGNNERWKGAKIQRKTAIKRGPAGNKCVADIVF